MFASKQSSYSCSLDVGGKLLTNQLKHLISFRQWNMIDQTTIVNAVREACGYISMDWKGDLEKCKSVNDVSDPLSLLE